MTARSALLREVRVELDKHLRNASAHELVEAADAMVELIEAKIRQDRQDHGR